MEGRDTGRWGRLWIIHAHELRMGCVDAQLGGIRVRGRDAEFSAKFARPPSWENYLKILRHLIQLLAIRILISNAAMKIYCAIRIGKAWCILLYSHWSQLRHEHHPAVPNIVEHISYIAPLPKEKKNILGLKSSLRHWIQLPNFIIAPSPTTECFK